MWLGAAVSVPRILAVGSLLGAIFLLLFAGHETTTNHIANGLLSLGVRVPTVKRDVTNFASEAGTVSTTSAAATTGPAKSRRCRFSATRKRARGPGPSRPR